MSTLTRNRGFGIDQWPSWAARWLGYRSSPPKPEPQLVAYFWSFVASFCALGVLQAIFGYASYFQARHVPSVIGSFGASAVLCFDVIAVPLAQPRALVGGHFVSALVGVCITKLIHVGHDSNPDYLRWLAGSLSTALAIVAMRATKTTHPPAGATALLAAVEPSIYNLGWYYLPVILLSSVIILVLALFFNNIHRRYPTFWIEPGAPPKPANTNAPAPVFGNSTTIQSSGESKNNTKQDDLKESNGGMNDLEKGSAPRL